MKKIGIIVFLLIALFLLLEAGSRVYFWAKYGSSRYLAYGFSGKAPSGRRPGGPILTGGPFSGTKPAGVYRILCLGGSPAKGGRGYPSILRERLDVLNLPFKAEVAGAGLDGSSSGELLAFFCGEGLKYDPDMIIFCEGFNDYHRIEDFGHILGGNAAKGAGLFRRAFNALYHKSLFFAIIAEKGFIFTKKVYLPSSVSAILSGYSENVRKMADVAAGNNVKVILVKEGASFKGRDMAFGGEEARSIAGKIAAGEPVSREEVYYYLHSATRDTLDDIARLYGARVVDAHKALARFPAEEVFHDATRLTLTEKGSEVVAGALAEEIQSDLPQERAGGKDRA